MGRIGVRVQPRGRRDEIVGARDRALLVRVTARPVDGVDTNALRRELGLD